jgi:dTDP-4-dehydrorhamnose reductase
MKKLLILGISGLTGYKIVKISTKYELYGTYNVRPIEFDNCITTKLDLTNQEQVDKIFSEIRPDLVINTTALHNVDFCEDNKEMASNVNTNVVQSLKKNSDKFGSKLVHISTDYVFDGMKTAPYSETDTATPVSFYGQSKLDGEKVLQNTKHAVLRPSVVYGWTPLELAGTTSSSGKPMNFAMWLLTKLNKNEQLKIVTDQFASATLADSLAESAIKIAESDKGGLYHVAGLSCESRYDFSVKFAQKFGYDSSLIQKTDSSQFKQKAKRPSYSCLNCQKATKEFGLNLYTTDKALEIMMSQVSKEAPYLLGNK